MEFKRQLRHLEVDIFALITLQLLLGENIIQIPGVLVVHNNKVTFIREDDIGKVAKNLILEPTLYMCIVITYILYFKMVSPLNKVLFYIKIE